MDASEDTSQKVRETTRHHTTRRAGDKKRGRDGTKYSRFHKRNYLSHHLAAIVSAVVLTDASNIEDGITALKQRVTGLAPAGGA